MEKISAKDIAELRAETGLPMMECKKALVEAGGDKENAIKLLQKRGLDRAASKAGRETKSGLIEAYSHESRIGVLVEVLCETDFVARNEEFKKLAHDIALQIAAMNPVYVDPESIPAEVLESKKSDLAAEVKAEGKPAQLVDQIVEGKLARYYSEVCLLNQPFIKDQDKIVGNMINEMIAKIGEKIRVSRFIRYELGSF